MPKPAVRVTRGTGCTLPDPSPLPAAAGRPDPHRVDAATGPEADRTIAQWSVLVSFEND